MTNPEFIFELNDSKTMVGAQLEPYAPEGPCIVLDGYRIALTKPDEAREELLRFLKEFVETFQYTCSSENNETSE